MDGVVLNRADADADGARSEAPERATLLDVRAIPLSELLDAGNGSSVLARAVRRLAGEVAQPQDALAAFTSYVE